MKDNSFKSPPPDDDHEYEYVGENGGEGTYQDLRCDAQPQAPNDTANTTRSVTASHDNPAYRAYDNEQYIVWRNRCTKIKLSERRDKISPRALFPCAQFMLRQMHWTSLSVSMKVSVSFLATKTALNSSFCAVTADSKSRSSLGKIRYFLRNCLYPLFACKLSGKDSNLGEIIKINITFSGNTVEGVFIICLATQNVRSKVRNFGTLSGLYHRGKSHSAFPDQFPTFTFYKPQRTKLETLHPRGGQPWNAMWPFQ